jgi:hypothetical protein
MKFLMFFVFNEPNLILFTFCIHIFFFVLVEEEEECFVPEEEIPGKMGCGYRMNGGICLMPQEYPNAVNIVRIIVIP